MIDVSGDGRNNRGRPAAEARDEAVRAGVTINGLPILAIEPDLEEFYRDNVIGGPGAFVIPAASFETFADAILKKLVIEISETGGRERRRRAARSSLGNAMTEWVLQWPLLQRTSCESCVPCPRVARARGPAHQPRARRRLPGGAGASSRTRASISCSPTRPTICSSSGELLRPNNTVVDGVDDDWDKFASLRRLRPLLARLARASAAAS